ncbi:MAG: F0F1 ATP synthase subunit epsilon [Desulfatiglandales bacterium]
MNKLFLEVVTPQRVVVSRDVDTVVAPGTEGEFGVLPGHVLFLSGIVPGVLRYAVGKETTFLAVSSGFAEISEDRVSVLVDAAEKPGEIDVERAKRAMERAKKRLEEGKDNEDIDYLRAEAALQRALVRLKLGEKSI